MPKQSDLERAFETRWLTFARTYANDFPANVFALEPEFQFAPPRKWRFDYCHVVSRVAIELEGGTYSNGRHVRGVGYTNDAIKYNEAISRGWAVLRFTTEMLAADPMTCCAQIAALIESRCRP
jgi:hypothetical protein